ncbi:MAG: hypothetical protein ACK41R_07460, partial [Thermus sp.]
NRAAQTAADAHEAGRLAKQQAIATNRSAWNALIDGVVAQVQAFQKAQLTLIRSPEDEKAFNAVLPPNFCAYCHGLDGKAWREED